MHLVPRHHLSPSGRAVIEAESVRVKQELAARRAEREANLHTAHGLEEKEQLTLPLLVAAEVNPQAEHTTPRA